MSDDAALLYVVKPRDRNEALRYSLRSAAAHRPGTEVIIVGHTPVWIQGVTSVPVPQPRVEARNVVKLLRQACADRRVPERFILMNDDFLLLEEVEQFPLVYSGTCADLAQRQMWQRGMGWYAKALANTVDVLNGWGVADPLAFDRVHTPMPVIRDVMGEVLYRADKRDIMHRSLYGNVVGGGVPGSDAKVRSGQKTLPKLPWASVSKRAWEGAAGAQIRTRFRTPCRFER